MGFADALAAPEVAISLQGAGYRVVSFSRRGRPVALRRLRGVEIVEVTSPEDDFEACVGEVAASAGAYDVTMPLDDRAVLVCDRALATDALVAGPRGAQAELALDKRLQLRLAGDSGLSVPAWSEFDPEVGLPAGWQLPVVLKPALAAQLVAGRLQRHSPRLVATREAFEELRRTWGSETPAIVQQWVQGEGRGVFGLAEHGSVHHLSAHRRVRMMNPAGSGSSACASTPVEQALIAPIERMLGAWQGMFMVELLRSQDMWWFMELNGRAWGSLALARRLGYEYPAWAVARVLDAQAKLPDAPPYSELLCRNLGRELVHLLFVLRGPGSHVGAWPDRRQTLGTLLRSDRPTSWYNLAPGTGSLFLEDALGCVLDQTVRKRHS
jgi:hypothetical protein